jgi:hypothetical protein
MALGEMGPLGCWRGILVVKVEKKEGSMDVQGGMSGMTMGGMGSGRVQLEVWNLFLLRDMKPGLVSREPHGTIPQRRE